MWQCPAQGQGTDLGTSLQRDPWQPRQCDVVVCLRYPGFLPDNSLPGVSVTSPFPSQHCLSILAFQKDVE